MINKKLKKYIKNYIFPVYEKNDKAHNIKHIKYVIKRSMKFSNKINNINKNMVYTIAAYHDIAHHINAKEHEKLSSEWLKNDIELKKYFTENEIQIMADAVYDHRASKMKEPRTIYGKIISSADRNTNIKEIIKRTYEYRKNKFDENEKNIIDESYKHIKEKFGPNGYAINKIYFKDKKYDIFLKQVVFLINNKDKFIKKYKKINKIKK